MPSYITDDKLLSQLNAPASPLDKALEAEGVSGPVADISRSIYQQESSSGRNTRTSNAGAVGGMQVMPDTFKRMADPGWDINDPEHNARAGVRYVKTLYEQAGGDPKLTAAGYYGGEGGLEKARQGIAVSDPRNPKAPTTLQYADQVASRLPTTSSTAAPAAPAAPARQYVQDPNLLASLNAPANTPENHSFLQNLGDGLVKGASDLKTGVSERAREGLQAVGAKSVADSLGLPTPEAVAQKRQEDAPLMLTAGGKIGSFVAGALPAAIASLATRGRLGTATAIGAAQGLVEPTTQDESVLKNTVAGGLGGAAGYGVAKGVGALADKALQSAAKNASQNAAKDSVAIAARDEGYAIPLTQTNPTILNSALEGFSGKLSTAQKASIKNQSVTNNLVAKELGLPADQPISIAALDGLRQRAGAAYDAVANTGTVTPTAAYGQALDRITAPYVKAAQGFPNAPASPIVAKIDALRSTQFDAASAIAKIRTLREDATAAYASGDKAAGKALKAGANALEDALDTHLTSIGAPSNLLGNYRDARQLIAKTYDVQGALNDATGNVNAVKIGAKLAKGAPLTGNLQTIGKTAQAFPTAVKEVTSSMPGVSPLDFMGANLLHAAGSGFLSIASLGARPLTRAAILTGPVQRTIGAPSYGGSSTLNALASTPGRVAIRGAVPLTIQQAASAQDERN